MVQANKIISFGTPCGEDVERYLREQKRNLSKQRRIIEEILKGF